MTPPRIFIGLTEVSGYFARLSTGFRALGLDCTFYDVKGHPFRYQDDCSPRWACWLRWTGARRSAARGPARAAFGAIDRLSTAAFLLFCLWRYDVFIFGAATKFFRFGSLRLLELLGKRIIYVFLGSDSRPPYLNGSVMAASRGRSVADCVALTLERKEALRQIGRYADVIVDYPAAGHFHERPIVCGFHLGFPHGGHGEPPSAGRDPTAPVRILHSPSLPEAKGTPAIRQAIERIRKKGYDLEYVELQGQPNAIVLQELARCDFVVDQLYSDAPLAGFATEAATFGKPALVGGYYAEFFRQGVPQALIPPSHYVHPEEIERGLETLIRDRAYREDLGKRARAFVESAWSPRQVAARYLRLIEGPPPADWLLDPRAIRLVHGACLDEANARSLIRAVVEAGGVAALQLSDKPALERMLLEFARTAGPDAEKAS